MFSHTCINVPISIVSPLQLNNLEVPMLRYIIVLIFYFFFSFFFAAIGLLGYIKSQTR